MTFISFKKNDLIKVTATNPSGWWYGFKITGFDMDESKAKKGFFPGNYIKLLKSEDPDFVENEVKEPPQQQTIPQKSNQKSSGSSYMDYVNKTFADKEQLTIYHRREKMLERSAPQLDMEEQHAKDVLGAFNRFGIGNANPTKAVLRKTGYRLDKFEGKNVNLNFLKFLENFGR